MLGKSKRKANEAGFADVDLPNGWEQKLLELGPVDLAYVLASLANDGQITASQIKKARTGLPSFSSSARWTELAPNFDLPADLTTAPLDSFSIAPVLLLPPSFHETTAGVAWRVQDVYQELLSQEREEARVRVFDAVCPKYLL